MHDNVVHLSRPEPIEATRDGVAGTVTFDRGLVWRTGDHTEQLPLDRLRELGATREGHLVVTFALGLAMALGAQLAGLSVGWGVGALWAAAAFRIGLDRVRAKVVVTAEGSGEEWKLIGGPDLFAAVQAFRERLPKGVGGAPSVDERVYAALRELRSPETRFSAAWTLAWLWLAPLGVWTALFVVALVGAWLDEAPLGETLVILGMGPPLAVVLWPLSGMFGLLLQAPVTWYLARR